MDQIVLFGVFLLLGALNLLVRWLRSRAAPPPGRPDARPRPLPEEQASDRPALPPRGREPAMPWAAPELRPTPAAPAVAPPAGRRQLPQRLGSRAELRRAIVMMEILGPCRGATR